MNIQSTVTPSILHYPFSLSLLCGGASLSLTALVHWFLGLFMGSPSIQMQAPQGHSCLVRWARVSLVSATQQTLKRHIKWMNKQTWLPRQCSKPISWSLQTSTSPNSFLLYLLRFNLKENYPIQEASLEVLFIFNAALFSTYLVCTMYFSMWS